MNKVKRHLSIFLCYIFIVVSVLANTSIKALANETPDLEKVTGQIIIKLIDTNNKKYEEIIKSYNGKILGDNGQLILASFEGEDIIRVEEQCKLDSNIEYTEVNAAGEKSAAPTDSLVTTQDYLLYSNAMEAWDKVTPEMKKTVVKIAVIDSGIKTTHSEFVGKLLPGKNFLNGSTNVEDDNGHGTQVTGIIAANHDGKGIAGIAGLINTKIIPIKVLDKNGNGTTFNVASGIRYAADQGASIINISINGSGYSKVIDDAIQYANKKNVLTVVSAPNNINNSNRPEVSKYWPCNANGVITVGNNIKEGSNNIIISTQGSTTNIGSEGYCSVKGNSFSAAIVTGTAALIKSKSPSSSIEQLTNIIKNSKGIDEGNRVDILKAITSESAIVTMVNPNIEENVSKDLNGKIVALRPAEVKKIEVFLNSTTNLIKTFDGTGIKEYNLVIPYSDLLEGINKLTIRVVDKAGKKYEYDKYFISKSNSNDIRLAVKDKAGNPLANANVTILSGDSEYSYEIESGLTDSNGEFIVNAQYNYNNLKAAISYGDADKQQGNMYFIKEISSGRNIIDLSKESKEITIVGKKVDGTSTITNGKLKFEGDSNAEYKIPVSGEFKILVNKNNPLNVSLVSEEDGYYYNKQLTGLNTSDRFELKVDNSVAKLDITNALDKYIGNEEITISKSQYVNNKIGSFDIKNKSLYITKDKYYTIYSIENVDGKEMMYSSNMDLDLTSDKNIKIEKPELKLSENEEKVIRINMTEPSLGDKIIFQRNAPLTVSVVDKNGQAVKSSDYKYTLDTNQMSGDANMYPIEFTDLNNKLSGATATINFNMFGQKFSKSIKFAESTENISNVTLDYKIPNDMKTLLSTEDMNTSYLHYYVYDKATKKIVINNNEYQSGAEGSISIPSTYTNGNYGISMSIDKGQYSVLYNRTLQKSTDNKLSINSDNGETSRAKLICTDSNKIKKAQLSLNDGFIQISSKINEDLSTNVWCDNREVSYGVAGKSAIINGKITFSKTLQSININNIATNKFTIKAPITQYASSINIGYKFGQQNFTLYGVEGNSEILVSKDVIISSVNYKVNDFINNINANYFFSKVKDDIWEIDLNNISAVYSENNKVMAQSGSDIINAKITTLGFELKNSSSNSISNNIFSGNFINASGIVSGKVNLYISNYGVEIFNYSLKSGDYKFKFDFFGLNIKDEGMSVKVGIGTNKAIRIMDPNDITKPLTKGKVFYNWGSEKNIDRNGMVYLPENAISNLDEIRILVDNDSELLLFTPQSKVLTGNDMVAVTKASLTNKYIIKPSGSNSNIQVAYAKINLSGPSNGIYLNSFSVNNISVDKNGCKTILSTGKIDDIAVIGNNFMLNAKPMLNNEYIYNLKDASKLDVRIPEINGYLKINGSTVNLNGNGVYYVSSGDLNYHYYNDSNQMSYTNKIKLAIGATKIIQFGTNISLVASTDEPKITPLKEVKAKLKITDEYGNRVSGGHIKVNIYDGASITDLKSIDVKSISADTDGTTTVSFNTDVIVNKMNVEVEAEINGNKVKSNKVEYTYDLSNYKVIDVLAPNGDPIVTGELSINKSIMFNESFTIINGKVYIPKDTNFKSFERYHVVGTTAKDEKVIYSDLTLSDTTTTIKKQGKLITVNVGELKNITSASIRIYSLKNDSFGIQNDDYNNIKSLKYWIDTDYIIEYKLNGNSENYLLAKNISITDSIVNIVTTDLCEPGVVINNKSIKMENYSVSLLNNMELNMERFGTDQKLKVTNGMYIYNWISLSKDNSSENLYLYCNKEISTKSSKIAIGSELSLKVNCSNIVYSNNSINSCLDIKIIDEFNNEVRLSNYSVDIKSSDGKIVKTIDSDNRYETINVSNGVYDLEVKATNIVGVSTKVIKGVKIINSNNATINVFNTGGVDCNSLAIKDSSKKLLLSKSMVRGDIELQPNLKEGEIYTASYITELGDIEHYYGTVLYEGGNLNFSDINRYRSVSTSVDIDIDKNVEYLSIITEDGIKFEKDYRDYNRDSKKMTLISGQKYKLEALIKDNGVSYLINQDFVPTEANKTITWNKTNVKSISLNNSFKKGIEVCSGTITSLATKTTITNADLISTTTKLFVTPGKYDLSSVVILEGSDRAIKYKKAIDVTTKDTSVELGKNLTYDVQLNKKQFSVGEILTAQIANVKDGGTAITSLEGVKLSNISIDLLHGNKVIKTYVGSLPKTLKGDICIRVKGTSDTLGNISGKPIIINLSSTGNILEGDINLDGRVDIFDIVYIAKDYNKTSASTNWDPRVNLVATDKVVDIKDIAKVAANYTK